MSKTVAQVARVRGTVRHKLLRDVEAGRSYALVLLLVLITYFLYGSIKRTGATHLLVIGTQGVTLYFAFRVSNASKRARRFGAVLWGVMLLTAVAAAFGKDVAFDGGVARTTSAVLYLFTIGLIAANLARRNRVDQETLLGAITMYLLIGMFFAFLTYAIDSFNGSEAYFSETCSAPVVVGSTPESLCEAPALDASEYLFFSFVTLTTVGYGNLIPTSDLGQTLASFEAVCGTLFLILAIGRIVALVDVGKRAEEEQDIRRTIKEGARKELEELRARLDAAGIPRAEPPENPPS